MIIEGKYTAADVHAKTVEDSCAEQIRNVCNQEIFKDCKIQIMPDCHTGSGCVIGFTSDMPRGGQIVPNLIGVDIACGMLTTKIADSRTADDYAKLDKVIRRNVPAGFASRKFDSKLLGAELKEKITWVCKKFIKDDFCKHYLKCGSLGGGNHFISVEKDGSGSYLIVHSGSRNFGLKIASHFTKVAKEKCVEKYGEFKDRDPLYFLEGKDAEDYLACSAVAREYACLSRRIMTESILIGMRWDAEDQFETLHNYIGDDGIIRKGAISCKDGERVLIPLNMRDGSLICTGKGIAGWNNSGPHGAGRVMSRRTARESISMEDYKASMEGIFSSCISAETVDESPFAYKNGDEIRELVTGTADVVAHLKPVYNFKGGKE